MLSERLRALLIARGNADADISDIARSLRQHPNSGISLWLQDDLRQAIESAELTPEVARDLTYIGFQSQTEVEDWLQQCWTSWFPNDPYPGNQPAT